MKMRLNKQCHWQMVVVTYFACTEACRRTKSFSILCCSSQPLSKRKFADLICVYSLCLNILFRLNRFLPNIRLKPLNVILTSILETPKQVCILSCVKTIHFFSSISMAKILNSALKLYFPQYILIIVCIGHILFKQQACDILCKTCTLLCDRAGRCLLAFFDFQGL